MVACNGQKMFWERHEAQATLLVTDSVPSSLVSPNWMALELPCFVFLVFCYLQ